MADTENNNQQIPQNPRPGNMPPYPPPYPPYQRPRRSNWWIPVLIIGGIIILFFVFIAVVFSTFAGSFSEAFEEEKVELTDNSVLYLTFSGGLNEYAQSNPFEAFGGGSGGASFLETINAIKLAKKDDNIKGIYIKPTLSSIGWVKSQEVQEVLKDFKQSGKFIYAFIEVGDENMYFNTLPADSIFMPTEGIMEMNGFGASSLFLSGFMEKIGIKYHVEHFEDFKSAADMYINRKYSDSAKYQLKVLLDQRYQVFSNAVSTYRNLSSSFINDALNRGIYTADSLQALGFVDVLASEQSVREFIKAKVQGKSFDFNVMNYKYDENDKKKDSKIKLISVSSYMKAETVSNKDVVYDDDTQIAIINGVGAISSGTSGDSFGNDYEIKSGDFVKYLKSARNDKKIKAIILRIDSPGGSVIASDEIWEEIQKTKKVKPVYASMSDVAASGGYYMAMACDTIIAHPSTITGSIGVVMAVPNLSGLMGKLDMTADTISTNDASQFMNGMFPYDKKQTDKLHSLSEGIYFRFLKRVGESRGKTFEQVRAIAKGRVWTGEDAKKIGLVDTLGGMQTTLNIAKRRLGINPDTKVRVRMFPEKEDDFAAILKMFGIKKGGDEDVQSKTNFAKVLGLDPQSVMMSIDAIPEEFKNSIYYSIKLSEISQKENALVAMPYLIDIK